MSRNMNKCVMIVVLCGVLSAAAAAQQAQARIPQIGYLYPAGGQCGTVVRVIVGGQFLRGPSAVHITGTGIQAEIIQYLPPARILNRPQRQELQRRIDAVRDRRQAEESPKAGTEKASEHPDSIAMESEVSLPDHPLWYDLESKSLGELAHIASVLSIPRSRLQRNRQLAESVLIDITINADAPAGDRELRLVTAAGVTNPMVFQVGHLPEVRELEPNDGAPVRLPGFDQLPEPEPLQLPVLINGQIMPGDVDRFRFHAKKDMPLVVDVQARRLIPYLADAVPGWFQAVVTLFDANGNEVAFADNYRFDPDPVLFYTVPETGVYELEIRDAIYRGREDFVYRIAVGPLPFVTHMFPLGGRQNAAVSVSIEGWNLPASTLFLETQPGDQFRSIAWQGPSQRSNVLRYAVDTLPEQDQTESNNTLDTAVPVTPPVIINGTIASPEDVDIYSWKGRANETIAVEVYARRLHSPLDSLIRLIDANGVVLKWNDDDVIREGHLFKDEIGLLTHHADSYLLATLPSDGRYYIHLTDAQGQGGPAYGYRLRISPPRPDFRLRMTPSSLGLRVGQATEFSVYVLPKDGFSEDIEIVLVDAPPGFTLSDNRIAAGSTVAKLTLAAPRQFHAHPVALRLEGRAVVDGRTISRPVVPADERMQAFLYRHLVPAQELIAVVQGRRRPAQTNR